MSTSYRIQFAPQYLLDAARKIIEKKGSSGDFDAALIVYCGMSEDQKLAKYLYEDTCSWRPEIEDEDVILRFV